MSEQEQPQNVGQEPKADETKPDKLPLEAHIACGWPLLLVLFGGALGGGLGGAAYGLNVKVYRSSLPLPGKIALNLASGAAAFGVWYTIASAIAR